MKQLKSIQTWLVAGAFLVASVSARAAYLPVYGGPTYDSSTGNGLQNAEQVSDIGTPLRSGVGVGSAVKYTAGGSKGLRAVRFDAFGNAAELGILGTDSTGFSGSFAYAVNNFGTVVGGTQKYVAGSNKGTRAVRWDASGTAATDLGNLGTDSSGRTDGRATDINNAGVAIGYIAKYDAGNSKGSRAVRWDASSTVATELGNIGEVNGFTSSQANAINDAGTAVGSAMKFDGFGDSRAVRWDAAGTATELGIGTDYGGANFGNAYALNNSGTAVGYVEKHDSSGGLKGFFPMRWDASSAAATELGDFGADPTGVDARVSFVFKVNSSGAAVGRARKFGSTGYMGDRAARWNAGGTTATELGILGSDPFGVGLSAAYAINDAGLTVGYSEDYDDRGNLLAQRAVMWGQSSTPIVLNDLIDPASGWTLIKANGITNDGWITGIGGFDPDGPGGLDGYTRLFLIHVPEPSTFGLVVLTFFGIAAGRRTNSAPHTMPLRAGRLRGLTGKLI